MKPTHKRLIMGTMGLGGSWESPDYEPADIDLAHAVLKKAKEIGIDTLDTADIYRHGASESVIGEVFKRDRELERHFRVQTKCSIQLPNLQHPWTRYNSAGTYIREAIELSARKLGRAPEIMLLHRFDPLMDLKDTAFAIKSALDSGTIGAWGVSNYSAWQVERLADEVGSYPVANQLELSLSARGFVEHAMNAPFTGSRPGSDYQPGTVEYCADHEVQVQAWSPLARGAFSAPEVSSPTADKVRELAQTHETTPATIVLWWLTMHPAGIVPVIGTTNAERIASCRDALGPSKLTRLEWYELLTTVRGGNCP